MQIPIVPPFIDRIGWKN